MPLALGNPEHGVTLGALEEAIEILLAFFLPATGTQLGQWGNQGEIPLIFGPAAGNIAADPFWRGPEKNACRYCDYAAACHFEEGRGEDRRRWLPSVGAQEFWAQVEKED